ncbi:hypothetical protein QO034_07880 [Sedimentitalea sp. JM2-8]|uniref:Type IV pilus biogenesis protein PilP n=1 Tax=Sedimentitalea xiamensis TaxID=3050037 RepID=A0ABT7FDI0_9RHOB|nr:hypothetical protein [Sedimentitalea xiamensis]MDK3073025.1 hypothetical protein [Sedimentitalea xiamensis]
MKPEFALSLSFEGISLLFREPEGWRSIGDVDIDAEDLDAALAALRAKALALSPDGVACGIVIPNDQIRYLTVETGSFEGETRREMARAALEGATPYDVADLVFDLSFDGDRTHIAAVARETLQEAEAFAETHGFQPLRFFARPGDMPFAGEPDFGPAKPVPVDAPAEPAEMIVETPKKPDLPEAAQAGPESSDDRPAAAESAPESTEPDNAGETGIAAAEQDAETATPTGTASAGFASRRRKPDEDTAAPALAGATRDPAPQRAERKPDSATADPAGSKPAVTPEPADDPVAEPEIPATVAVKKNPVTQFLSRRRKRGEGGQPKPRRVPPAAPAPEFETRDETERMTVFGARQRNAVGGKPRHLGLILTAGLLFFLAVVAAWSLLFTGEPVSVRDDPAPENEQAAAAPPPRAPDVQTTAPGLSPTDDGTSETTETAQNATPDQMPLTTAPEQPTDEDVTTDTTPASRALTDTDSAVLDALQDDGEPDTADPAADYAESGVWTEPPEPMDPPAASSLDDLYEVSIDRRDLAQDAIAIPPQTSFATDQTLAALSPPAAAGTAFELGDDGLVQPTAAGALNPDGILVYLGRPPVVPPATPTRFDAEPAEAEAEIRRDRLALLRPSVRPEDLVEQTERSQLGGLTLEELGRVRPKLRPEGVQQQPEIDETPTAQAVARSRVPSARPRDFAGKVQKAQREQAGPSEQVATATIAPRTVTPKIPSSASVARQATLDNAINLRRINLIGVYGTASNRRALVRLPSGRYQKVKVGDRIDGGRIVAIGDSELRYQKSGRNTTLKIPSG